MTEASDLHHLISDRIPAVGVGIMLIQDNKVLMGRRQSNHGAGSFGWPGGGLKFGEKLESAVRREAYEEVGVVVKNMRLICVSNIIAYGRHYVDFEFRVDSFEGKPKLREPDKSAAWDWYDLNALPQPLFRPCELALQSLKSGQLLND